MRKLFLFLIFLIHIGAFAQEGLAPLTAEEDTFFMSPAAERQLMYHQMLFPSQETLLFSEIPEFPDYDFSTGLARHWQSESFSYMMPFNRSYLFPGSVPFYPSPFLQNGTVLSEGYYQISGKLKIGGYSYGANSVFSAPFPQNGFNNFDIRGANMFMQYKVSKNFKIETHINVQQGGRPY